MHQGIYLTIFVAGVFAGSTEGSNNGSNSPTKPAGISDPLTSLGDITTKLVTTLVEAEGEQVDIYGMANMVTALSKAATIVEHPEMYKELTTNNLEEQLIKLSSTVKVLAEQQKSLQESIHVQQERLSVIDEMAHELNQSQALISRLEEQVKNEDFGSGSAAEFIGFTAWADVSSSYSSDQAIKFPQVLFNYGAGFDRYNGKFTCPISGIYSVNAHLEERNSGGLIVDIMLDSDSFNRLHVHDDSTEHGTSASSSMVGCRQGQQIYLKNVDSGAEIQSIEKRTLFSVFLLQAMSDEDVRAGNMIES